MSTGRWIYESFNARNLTPEEVAKTFIVPDEFEQLCGNNHIVLMGPRGSGKTTMLKMLTPRALSSWEGVEALQFRSKISFTAIYVPTDIHWHHQLKHSSRSVQMHPDLERKFSEAAVTTNILAAVSDAFQSQLILNGWGRGDRESELCKGLIREWRLPPTLPLLDLVFEALAARLSDLYVQFEKARAKASPSDALAALPDYVYLDYLAAVRFACILFDRLFAASGTTRWALCFDELELAPEWLQTRLFSELRSSDERFFFKLSTSPIPNLKGLYEAKPTQDFRVIRLWSQSSKPSSRGPRSFCERLVESLLERAYGSSVTSDSVFGSSPTGHYDDDRAYTRGSFAWSLLRDLAEVDSQFRTVLEKNEIPPDDPFTSDIHKRDQVLRKAKPLALHRLSLMKHDKEGKVSRRSRKIFNIYYGKEIIYDISDGNPRWLNSIISDMMTYVKVDRLGKVAGVPRSMQERILRESSRQFLNFISSVPDSTVNVHRGSLGLTSMLESLGHAFFRFMVIEPFNLDPVGSFRVDRRTPLELLPLIRLAAYHGAIVMVDTGDWVYSDPLDRRFRLSYLLAPEFKLPLRLYKAAPLSRILRLSAGRKKRVQSTLQGDLPLGGKV